MSSASGLHMPSPAHGAACHSGSKRSKDSLYATSLPVYSGWDAWTSGGGAAGDTQASLLPPAPVHRGASLSLRPPNSSADAPYMPPPLNSQMSLDDTSVSDSSHEDFALAEALANEQAAAAFWAEQQAAKAAAYRRQQQQQQHQQQQQQHMHARRSFERPPAPFSAPLSGLPEPAASSYSCSPPREAACLRSADFSPRRASTGGPSPSVRAKALQVIDHELQHLLALEERLREQLEVGSPPACSSPTCRGCLVHQPHQALAHAASHGTQHAGLPVRSSVPPSPAAQARRAAGSASGGAVRVQAASASSGAHAALLAACAGDAAVERYVAAHHRQQHQHQACMAAVSSTARAHGGLSTAAQNKLAQLMAVQKMQLQIQEELLALLPPL